MDYDAFIVPHAAAFWVFVGVALLVAEAAVTFGFFVPFAIGSFVTAGMVAFGGAAAWSIWQLFAFAAGTGLVLLWPCRRVLRRLADKTPDINQY